jgi:hypothetical protein
MTGPHTENRAKNQVDELFTLFESSAKVLARSADPTAFLDWIARYGPSLAPDLAGGIDPRAGPPGLFFGAMAWKATRKLR